jgi:TPR repeat protein
LFRRLFAAANGGVSWVDGADQATKFLARKGVDKLVSSLGRIQRSQVETGIVSRWDISLLSGLLSRVEWKIDLTDFAIQIGALPPITTVRNNISHLAELKVDQKSFDQWKKLLKTSLLSFDIDGDEIERIISAGTLRSRHANMGLNQKFCPAGSATSTTSRSQTMTEAEKSKFEAEKAAGNAAFKAGQYDTAIERYSNALSVPLSSVNCAMILSNRSFCFIRKAESNPGQAQYNYLKALQDAKEAVSAHPAWGKGYYRKGVCYLGLGKPEKAKLGPFFLLFLFGSLSFSLTRLLTDLDKAVALIPEDPDLQRVRATAVDRVHSRLRKDHLNPQVQHSIPDQVQNMEQRMGMPELGLGGVSGMLDGASQMLRSFGDRASLGLLDLQNAHASRDGLNCVADEAKAYRLYKSAADVGVIEAKYNLAVFTLKGRGCPPDPISSLRMMHEIVEQPGTLTSKNGIVRALLEDSSKQIPGLAMYSISLHYSNGIAVPRDLFKAFEWIEKAAQAGSAQGYDALGLAYWNGDGVARDLPKAKQCLETAVKKGDVNALVNLASFHVSGLASAVPDFDSARRLLEEAKKRGHGAADEVLARLPPASSEETAALNRLAAEQPAVAELLKETRMMMERKAKPVKAGRRNTAELPDSIAGSSPYACMLQTAVVHWAECMSLFEKLTSGSSESTEIFQSLISEFYRATELADYICGWPSEFFSRLAPIAEVFYSKNPHRSDVAYVLSIIWTPRCA